MAPAKNTVFAVIRTDYEHKTSKDGSLHLLEIHATSDSANACAKSHLASESEKATGDEPEIKESAKAGLFEAQCFTHQGQRNNFKVQVVKYDVKEGAEKEKKVAARPKAAPRAKKAPTPVEDEDEDEEDVEDGEGEDEDEEPAPKKAAPKKAAPKKAAPPKEAKKAIPEGIPNALQGLKVLFTGTFDSMDRKTCKATAEKYGAKVISKMEDTDYIIMGTKAGPNKIAEIKEKDLETVDEEGFFDLLRDGVPDSKRARMAANAAADDAEAPPKKKSKK